MSLYAEERQQQIVAQTRAEGRVEVAALAEALAVTQETIRRDLDRLERQGLVRRVHGGAIPAGRLDFEPELTQRDTTASREKAQMARAVLALLPREGTILLDAGTSTARVAAGLPEDSRLTVVTNSVPIASQLATRPNLTVLLIGGRVRARTMAAVDSWALETLGRLRVDVAVVGTNGLSVEGGLTTADIAEAGAKTAMVASGRRVVVLADSSKYGSDHFARFAHLRDVDVVVSDAQLAPEAREAIAGAGPEVVIA